MNNSCANCNKPIERDRIFEILCAACELKWWNSVKAIYELRLKEFNDSGDKKS